MASHRVYVIGVRGKDKGEIDKEKERLEEEMVALHCCAEKQAALSALKPASLFLLNNFISFRIHLLNYILLK